jgi:hypothetical protein
MSHDPLNQRDAVAPRECALWGRRSEIAFVSEGFMKLPSDQKDRGAPDFRLIEGENASSQSRHESKAEL